MGGQDCFAGLCLVGGQCLDEAIELALEARQGVFGGRLRRARVMAADDPGLGGGLGTRAEGFELAAKILE